MRKRAVLAIVFLLVPCLAFGVIHNTTKGFDLQGGYRDFFTIKVTPLDATSHNFIAGMPFNLESDQIEYGTPDYKGLLIAKWEMLSNNPDFVITVTCEPLVYDGEKLETSENVVDYIITFSYPLSYYVGGQSESDGTETVFSFSSDPTIIDNRKTNPLTDSTIIDPDRFVGTNDGKIFFKLTELYKRGASPVDSKLHITQIKDGYYSANVVVNLEMVK